MVLQRVFGITLGYEGFCQRSCRSVVVSRNRGYGPSFRAGRARCVARNADPPRSENGLSARRLSPVPLSGVRNAIQRA